MFNKSHYLTIGGFLFLFVILYLGFDTKPKEIRLAEKSRAGFIESTNIQNLLQEAREELRSDEMGMLDAMYMRVEMAENDSARIQEFKNLSSNWYAKGYYSIAGHYAEEVAKLLQDELSWSIAGTTYASGIKNSRSEKASLYSASKSRQAFENAISINPDNLNHKINLAVTFAEQPISNDPMRGVMMLLDLNRNNPDNTSVLFQLARFGLQTGQTDKAIERLEKAISLEPDNMRIICLLAEAYETAKNKTKADFYSQKCKI